MLQSDNKERIPRCAEAVSMKISLFNQLPGVLKTDDRDSISVADLAGMQQVRGVSGVHS